MGRKQDKEETYGERERVLLATRSLQKQGRRKPAEGGNENHDAVSRVPGPSSRERNQGEFWVPEGRGQGNGSHGRRQAEFWEKDGVEALRPLLGEPVGGGDDETLVGGWSLVFQAMTEGRAPKGKVLTNPAGGGGRLGE